MRDGIVTGIISSLVFNPIDRALFLRIREQKSFFNRALWTNPYQGVSKAAYSKVVGYGVYFSIYDICRDRHSVFFSSMATALSTTCLTHVFNVHKAYQWSHLDGSISKGVVALAREQGIRFFFRGIFYTALRDCLFTGLYFSLSSRFNPDKNFTANVLIASSASAVSSPVNYMRSRMFFNFKETGVTFNRVFKELKQDMLLKNSVSEKIVFLAYNRFDIGLGTLRVGGGIALADWMYRSLK